MQANVDGAEQRAQQYAHRVSFFASKVARIFGAVIGEARSCLDRASRSAPPLDGRPV